MIKAFQRDDGTGDVRNPAAKTHTTWKTTSSVGKDDSSWQGRSSSVSQQPQSIHIGNEEGKQHRPSFARNARSALKRANFSADFEQSYELHERARNLRRAVHLSRTKFLDAASKFVSASAVPNETVKQFDSMIWQTYSLMRSIHDVYGWMEDDCEQLDKKVERDFRRLVDHAERLEQVADADEQLVLPGTGSTSEASEASLYDIHEVVLFDWLNTLARAEWIFKSLKEIESTKADIIESSAGPGHFSVSVAPYPADLIAGYDRESKMKAKELRTLEVCLVDLRQKMREVGFAIPDDGFNFEVGLLTGKGPARNPLLLPLDHLMTEAYDKRDSIQMDSLPQTPGQKLADHVNAWLMHVMRRSSLQAQLLTLQLADYDISMDENTASTVLDFWPKDEPTQRLTNMSSHVYYTQRGSEVLPEAASELLASQVTSVFPATSDYPPVLSSVPGVDSLEQVDIFADVDLATVPVVRRESPHEGSPMPPSAFPHSSSWTAQTPESNRSNNRTRG